jgi:hypothetical protein
LAGRSDASEIKADLFNECRETRRRIAEGLEQIAAELEQTEAS